MQNSNYNYNHILISTYFAYKKNVQTKNILNQIANYTKTDTILQQILTYFCLYQNSKNVLMKNQDIYNK